MSAARPTVGDRGGARRAVVPGAVCGVRDGDLADLLPVRRGGGGGRTPSVRAVRASHRGPRGSLRRLSASRDRRGSGAFPVRGPGLPRRQGNEVRRLEGVGPPPRRGDGRGLGPANRGRGDLGPVVSPSPGPARIRPGRGTGLRGGSFAGYPDGADPGTGSGYPGPGPPEGSGPPANAGGRLPRHQGLAPASPTRRRRTHNRRDRGGLRRRPQGPRGGHGAPAHGGALGRRCHPRQVLRPRLEGRTTRRYYERRARVWVCGCPGDLPPVVDASRRRNDPRKVTVGC